MKEIKRILEVYEKVDHGQRRVALATVVSVEGSSYRRPGARMLVTDDGRWEGAISGGCLEGDALRKARQVMRDRQPMLIRYDTTEDGANSLGVGLGCHGIIDVLIEPIAPQEENNPIALLGDFMKHQDTRVLATVYRSEGLNGFRVGTRFVLTQRESKNIPDWLGSKTVGVMHSGKSLTFTYEFASGRVDVLIERIDSGIELVIFGAGYDTVPLTQLATQIGWPVTVTEDCIAHLAPKRFPTATCLLYADAQAVTDKIRLTDRTAAVLMSHNFKYDQAVLTKLLATDVPYIGVLGPRKRYEKMQAEWEQAGNRFSAATLSRVHSPIGLDLGAETPDEIALSIVAEIKAFFNGRPGGFLKDKPGPIHEHFLGKKDSLRF
jgi:xanthine/CO dehydrogenase XdhC/CoxF family maturation factor